MANTYSQIYIQLVFAVNGRQSLIQQPWKNDLYSYIGGIIKGQQQKSIIINGMPDHVHIFASLDPIISISNLVRDIKSNSSKFVNEKEFVQKKFSWQGGFGAFSYGKSQLATVYDYILNQESHHKKKSFQQEYVEFLNRFEIEFNPKYLFEWID